MCIRDRLHVAHTWFFFRVFAFVPVETLSLLPFTMRPSSPFYPVPSVLPFVVLCASRFVHSFVFCLSSNEVLKDNNAVDATSVTTLYLTHKALSDVSFKSNTLLFSVSLYTFNHQKYLLFNFGNYPDNVLDRELGKAWPQAQHSPFTWGTFSFFFYKKNDFDF